MQLPEFDSDRTRVLFFVKGRGRGHALPSLEIVEELETLRPDIQVRFVSYGTGATTIAEAGVPVIDLANVPEEGEDARMITAAGRLLGRLKPHLVVSHEEFMVFPAAKIFNLPVIGVLDWFIDQSDLRMRTLQFADRILFVEEPDLFIEPDYLTCEVSYFGRFSRTLEYGRQDKAKARRELRLTDSALVVSVFPGAFATEERSPLADLLLAAFERLPGQEKLLVWVAGSDRESIESKAAGAKGVRVLESVSPPDSLMSASDVGVTKGNRGSAIDLLTAGTPVVVVTSGHNEIDDQITARLQGAVQVAAAEATAKSLAATIANQVGQTVPPNRQGNSVANSCAKAISEQISRWFA